MVEGQPTRDQTYPQQTMSTDPKTGAQKAVSLDRYDLIPPKALEQLAEVYGRGALKYADRNWEKGYSWGKSFRALVSHAFKAWRGEWYDKHNPACPPGCVDHTGLPHLAQAAWHCFALLTYYDLKLGTDDRSTTGKPITASEILQRRAEVNREEVPPQIDLDQMRKWAEDFEKQKRKELDDRMIPLLPGKIVRREEFKPFEFTREGKAEVARPLLTRQELEEEEAKHFCPDCRDQVENGKLMARHTQCGRSR